MPWQRHVADVALEVDPVTGRLVYRDVLLTVPRQSGKTTLILAVAVHRALAFGSKQRMVYTAQTRIDARKKLVEDWWPVVERSPFERVCRLRQGPGDESIKWSNHSMLEILATTEKAGHGRVLDLAFVDEAFHLPDERSEQAFKPAMMTRPQPQLWVVSTAGGSASSYLRDKTETGRAAVEAGVTSGLAYFEWSAPDGADPADRSVWWSCMPALGFVRADGSGVTEEAIAADFEALRNKPGEFRRAYLNQWVDRRPDPVFTDEQWLGCADPGSSPVSRLALAVEMTFDRAWTSLAIVGENADGLPHGEVVEHRSGTSWIVPRIVELVGRHGLGGVALDPSGPARSLIPGLEDAGVEVLTPTVRDVAGAVGQLYDAVLAGGLRHLDDPVLNQAVRDAVLRTSGDLRTWSRRESGADISPLLALTVALWALSQPPSAPFVPLVAYR